MINNSEKKKYLSLTIKLVSKQLSALKLLSQKKYRTKYDQSLLRELKSPVDKIIEKEIINNLIKTDINILSEETGFIKLSSKNK